MDPQQRMALELAYEGLENSVPSSLRYPETPLKVTNNIQLACASKILPVLRWPASWRPSPETIPVFGFMMLRIFRKLLVHQYAGLCHGVDML